METLHITDTTADRARAVTLCGIRFVTNHRATDLAKASGQWVSCPVCEAIALLDSTATAAEPEPFPQPDGTWIQPPLFG